MASGIYYRFLANLLNKEVDMEADTIKLILLTSSHTFTATHNTYSQISANEVSNGSGYTTGGFALSNKTVTQGATTKWDADDLAITGLTKAFAHLALYDDTTASDDLIASLDVGSQSVTSANVNIIFNSAGIITLTEV